MKSRDEMLINLTDNAPGLIAVFNTQTGQCLYANKATNKILGYGPEDFINGGRDFVRKILHPEDHLGLLEQCQTVLETFNTTKQNSADDLTTKFEYRVLRKDGTWTWLRTEVGILCRDHNNQVQEIFTVSSDISELKEAEDTIRYHAMHDTLTGLANRKALDEHFNVSKSIAIRHGNKIGLIFLDLDRFKTINDTLGHGIGDLVLKEVAERLKKAVRKVDIVARLGGDEFVLLINEVHSAQNIAKVANKILETIRPNMNIQDHNLHVTASMGIAMFADDGQDIYSLLKNADTALYRAKDAGRNRYQFYDYSMNLQSGSKLSLEQDLRTAVTNNELYMEYQPFIDIKSGKVLGVEALVRWKHPKLGIVHPFDFIPLSEEIGMIIPIGKWILENVCRQGQAFEQAGHPLKMTVNLSARQFSEAELVKTIIDALHKTGYSAQNLEVEITESVAMDNIARTSLKLNDLKELGISISIDDFGTGYSSLSYLKKFPVQKLKIDKSFVKHAITDPQDSTIIRAIISMGKSLGLTVCAEGVEDEHQFALLRSMDCDIAQGYLISKPLPAEQLMQWLKHYNLVREGSSY